MSTFATAVWIDYMNRACTLPDYPTAVFSGIKGDKRHAKSGGYHISIEDQPKDNYSVTLPKDKAPPGKWSRNTASAGDRSMSTADMIKAWGRWLTVWNNRAIDPRAKYVRAYNGWNGRGSAERLDFAKGTRTLASSDHKWHDHREGYRCYSNDPELVRALISIERGETIQQYMGRNTTHRRNDDMYMVRQDGQSSVDVYDKGEYIFHVQNEPERDELIAGGMQFYDGVNAELYAKLTSPPSREDK